MTAVKEAESFVKQVLAQQEINRQAHGDPEADDERQPQDWGVIAAEHMGHLLGALRNNDPQAVEKEILHVAGPLLECWNAVKSRHSETYSYRCKECQREFNLSYETKNCPVCGRELIEN